MLKNILIIDLETSGLDPVKDKIFEIAAISINKESKISRFQKIVTYDILPPMGPIVIDMHIKNGLFDEMYALKGTQNLNSVISDFENWLRTQFLCLNDGTNKERFIIAGKNVAKLDLPMLFNNMRPYFNKTFEEHIGHRYLDLGSVMFIPNIDCESGKLKDLDGCLRSMFLNQEDFADTIKGMRSHRALNDSEKVLYCLSPSIYNKYLSETF